MWQSAVALFAACLCAVSASDEEQPKTFGGSEAAENEFPFQVCVFTIGYFKSNTNRSRTVINFCGGTIISASWVLTAAHCVKYPEPMIYVGYGSSHNPLLGIPADDLSIFEMKYENVTVKIVHEEYQSDNLFANNDIALLKMRNPIPLDGKKTAAAVLPDFNEPIPLSEGLIIGWGDAIQYGIGKKDLRKLDVQVYNCNYTKNVTIPKICTKGLPGSAVCHGYSGESLILGGKVFGVSSFLAPERDINTTIWECGNDLLMMYYESVASHRKWIQNCTQV